MRIASKVRSKDSWSRPRQIATIVASAAAAVSTVSLTTASLAGASGKANGGTLDIANFVPFSGTNASFGPLALSGCYPGVYGVNKAGGVLGHQLACTSVDTRGDPTDAIAAANALVAHDANVVAVFGPASTTALATTPTLYGAHLPTFLMAGNSQYDHGTNPFQWRLTPPDDAAGWAKAAWAHQKGYTRAAVVYATTTASGAGAATAAISGFKKLGGKEVAKVPLTAGQPSYSTEAEQVASARPQVIFFTAPADTSATFFGELRQLMGSVPPAFVTEVSEEPDWLKAVGGAIGDRSLAEFVCFETTTPSTSTPGWRPFHSAITSDPQKVATVSQYFQDPFTLTYYDAVNLVALAMVETKSTSPATFDPAIAKLADAGGAKTVVHTFAQGVKALKAGRQIQYVGADGPLDLNKYHQVAGSIEAVTEGAHPKPLGHVTQKLMDKAAL